MNKYSFKRNNHQIRKRVKVMDVALIFGRKNSTPEKKAIPVKHQFNDFTISEKLLRNISEKGYMAPTPVQDKVIPLALENRDVVGIADTGSGKTAAFLIPLINKVLKDRNNRVLIVTPTRELAVQIQDELRLFAKGMDIFSALCIGGVGMNKQIHSIRKKPHFVVGTPGRIKDLKEQGYLPIALFNNIVLDEVDRMLDMGFIHDVRFIISHLPRRRQSLFFSATISPTISSIIKSVSFNPITIVAQENRSNLNIDQDVIKTYGRPKIDVLKQMLRRHEFKKVIIFGRTKWGVEKLSKQLAGAGLQVVALHGNKNQNQRQRSLELFRNNKISILLATDVVARGIDVDDVSHVINYELPETYDDYIHRIGRTGRNNKRGVALSFAY